MSIEYTYEIINVDEQARCMEVVFSSPGRQTLHVGTRLPYQGENLEVMLSGYAPVPYWLDQEAQVALPAVGTTGVYVPPAQQPRTLDSAKQTKKADVASWRFALETAGITVNGTKVLTDRESQAQLTGAYASLKNGLITSVDWKSSTGAFVTLGLPEVEALAQAVAQHVQSSFTQEKVLVEQIDACTNIAEVDSVQIPAMPGVIPVTQL